jgi:hypothetical protein
VRQAEPVQEVVPGLPSHFVAAIGAVAQVAHDGFGRGIVQGAKAESFEGFGRWVDGEIGFHRCSS